MLCFHFVHHWGIPHLHPIILPLVPCPFWGCPSDWSQVPSWGVHQSQAGGCTPVPGGCIPVLAGWGTPLPGQNEVPLIRDRMEYPLTMSEWGNTLARTGVPPSQVRMGYPCQTGYAWTGYATGGTPFAVSRRRTVLFCFGC